MKRFNGRHIVVTGGAGFIGSHLVEALMADGAAVTVLDNFSTGKRENIQPFIRQSAFRLIEGDIRDAGACSAAMAGADAVLHEAALGSVPRSIADPVASAAVNITGFVTVLHCAARLGIRRVVYASSSSVYGDCTDSPKTEARTGRALSPYALTKRVDELFAENFHELYGTDCLGLRYFNVFGPRQDPASQYAAVIPRFITALLAGCSPEIYGDGSNSRDFTYIDNVVQANLRALEVTEPAALNRNYNIACGAATSLNTLFAGIRQALAQHEPRTAAITAVYRPPRPGDIPHSLADISLARQCLGYSPQVCVAEGLRRTAQWYWQEAQP